MTGPVGVLIAAVLVGAGLSGRPPPPPVEQGRSGGLDALEPEHVRVPECPEGGRPIHIWARFSPSRGLEVHPSGHWQRLAIAPAGYVVTRDRGDETRVVTVRPGRVSRLADLCLELMGTAPLDPQDNVPMVARSSLPAGTVVAGLLAGRKFGQAGNTFGRFSLAGWTGEIVLVIALTDRLQWPTLPALAYQFGDAGYAGAIETIPWVGMYDWGFDVPDEQVPPPFLDPDDTSDRIPDLRLMAFLGAGADVRVWLSSFLSLTVSGSTVTVARMAISEEGRLPPNTWRQNLDVGLSLTLPWAPVTFNFALSAAGNWLTEGEPPRVIAAKSRRLDFALGVGSGQQRRGLRRLPLIQIHLNDFVNLDVYTWGVYNFPTESWSETYMAGVGGVF